MSVSMQSETSKDEIEPEEVELEDIVWNLMSRTGLLSQIQGRISKFIEDNGKADNLHIYPDRANGRLLGLIFEYLQWIGMKQTNSVLLSESPSEVDLSSFESADTNRPDYRPELCRLFDEQVGNEDGGSPTRSHNYSKDEFEDSKLTSESGRQSGVNTGDNEAGENGEQKVHEESVSEKETSFDKNNELDSNANQFESDLEDKSDGVPSYTSTPKSANNSIENVDNGDMLINFTSPLSKGADFVRPNVTFRPRFDLNDAPDPFMSPVAVASSKSGKMSMGANFPPVMSSNRQSFSEAAESLDEILKENRSIEEKEPSEKSKTDQNNTSGNSSKVNKNMDESIKDQEPEKQKSNPKVLLASGDDDSTSDFMDTLTLEEDTQDVSIGSDSKGMSSCEHAVNLK